MPDWTEEEKGIIDWHTENRDWFFNGWFRGWFDDKTTPSFIEETKETIDWDKS